MTAHVLEGLGRSLGCGRYCLVSASGSEAVSASEGGGMGNEVSLIYFFPRQYVMVMFPGLPATSCRKALAGKAPESPRGLCVTTFKNKL